MVEESRPLLLFPSPSLSTWTRKRPPPPEKIIFPSPEDQGKRLERHFQALQDAFERKQAEIALSPAGTLPEQVLILQTVGSVYEFAKAVKAIRGMDWLSGLDQIEVEPDEDFYFENDSERKRKLKGQLFLLMTNQTALKQLLSLWNNFKQDATMRFPRGLAKWRSVFQQLKNIRAWNVEDRLGETGLLEDWDYRVKAGTESVHVEIETWFNHGQADRQPVSSEIERLIRSINGRKLGETVIPEIQYHGILAKLPISSVSEVLLGKQIELLKCDQVMFMRPVGQIVHRRDLADDDLPMQVRAQTEVEPLERPIVAVLDGLPMERHTSLVGRVIVDDPEFWSGTYEPIERCHGTAMCSLIVNGDLSIGQPPLSRKIYSRPILQPNCCGDVPRLETVPDDRLMVDLVHQAVVRIFGTGELDGVAPTVRFINFSVGDWNRQFIRFVSPLAKLLDWLSWKYNVLFIISAGNQSADLEIAMPGKNFDALSPVDQQKAITHALSRDSRNRRLISPAESLNSLTVGASHSDFSIMADSAARFNRIHSKFLPSPISAQGLGFRRAIKPEILMPGGRQLYDRRLDGNQNTTRLTVRRSLTQPPGVLAAAPSKAGDLDRTHYLTGTSNAAALTTRAAAELFELLQLLRFDHPDGVIEDEYMTVLVKALIVHGAEWGPASDHLKHVVPRVDPRIQKTVERNALARFLGYGSVSLGRLFECEEQRATLVGCGAVGPGEGHKYLLPLPGAIFNNEIPRRLIVTLAWLSPINPSHQAYRLAALWFELEHAVLNVARKEADWNAVKRGTVQHEIFSGSEVIAAKHGATVAISVNCREDAGNLDFPVPYGLVVTLETTGEIVLPIYDQVKARIAVPIRR
jgi:hypothetical protein